jgi:hypothetical protein
MTLVPTPGVRNKNNEPSNPATNFPSAKRCHCTSNSYKSIAKYFSNAIYNDREEHALFH